MPLLSAVPGGLLTTGAENRHDTVVMPVFIAAAYYSKVIGELAPVL